MERQEFYKQLENYLLQEKASGALNCTMIKRTQKSVKVDNLATVKIDNNTVDVRKKDGSILDCTNWNYHFKPNMLVLTCELVVNYVNDQNKI